MNNDAIAADLSYICLPFSDRVKPTNQSFFLSHLERQGWEVRRGGGSSRIASSSRARKTGLSQMMST